MKTTRRNFIQSAFAALGCAFLARRIPAALPPAPVIAPPLVPAFEMSDYESEEFDVSLEPLTSPPARLYPSCDCPMRGEAVWGRDGNMAGWSCWQEHRQNCPTLVMVTADAGIKV